VHRLKLLARSLMLEHLSGPCADGRDWGPMTDHVFNDVYEVEVFWHERPGDPDPYSSGRWMALDGDGRLWQVTAGAVLNGSVAVFAGHPVTVRGLPVQHDTLDKLNFVEDTLFGGPHARRILQLRSG